MPEWRQQSRTNSCRGLPFRQWIFPKLSDFFCKASNHLRESLTLGSRNPFTTKSPFIDTQKLHELMRFVNYLLCFFITFQVMAFTDVSTGDQDAVCALFERFEHK